MIGNPNKEALARTGYLSTETRSPVQFGREIRGSVYEASQREWLATNGIGGFNSGTKSGLLTPRHHGLLIPPVKGPLGPTLLVPTLQGGARYADQSYPLSTNRRTDGTLDPQGYRHIERFRLEGTTPVWTCACADAQLEKRVWMQPGANTSYVHYSLVRASRQL